MTFVAFAGVLRATTAYAAMVQSDQETHGFGPGWTFTPLALTVRAGIGPYNVTWVRLDDGRGVWNDLVGATPTPTVSAIALGDYSTARYQATVVDTGQGSISTQTNMVYLKYTHAYLGQFP